MRPSGSCLLLCLALTLCLSSDALAVSGGALVQAARYDYAGYRLNEWKRVPEAIVFYAAAIKTNPADFVAYFDRASCYLSEKEWSKALADCNAAAKLNPSYADTYYLRAASLYGLGRDAEVRADLERFDRGKISPAAREGAAHLRVSLCETTRRPAPDELRTSIQTLDRSVANARTAQKKAAALNSRACFFAVVPASSAANLNQALADATEAVRLKRDASYLDTLATVSARQGDYPEAIEVEKKALAMVWHDRGSKENYWRRLAAFQSHQPYFPMVEDRG